MEDRVPSNEEGPVVNLPNKIIHQEDFNRRLMAAVEQTDYEATAGLLRDNSFSPDVLIDSMTPLLVAISNRRIDFVKLLVSHGACVKWTGDPAAMPPFYWACAVGNVEIIKFLFDRGADVNTSYDNRGSLFYAVNSWNPEIISFLCDEGAAIDSSWQNEISPLWMACVHLRTSGLSRMAAVLLRHGVPVIDTCDHYESTKSMLHDAVQLRDKDCVVLLMECGAKPSSVEWAELDLTADRNFFPWCKRNTDHDFFFWCKRYMSRPLSLKCLSGQVVRRRLVETHKKSILPYLTQLELPKTLVEYLALDRFKYLERAKCLCRFQ